MFTLTPPSSPPILATNEIPAWPSIHAFLGKGGITAEPAMENELRSGRLIGYFFFIPCSIVAPIIFFQTGGDSASLFMALWFALGAAVGFHLLLWPKTLVKVTDENLELYPGTLFRNKKRLVVPLRDISDFDVRTVNDGDRTIWLLSLYLCSPQNIPESARTWIKSSLSKRMASQINDTTIHWSLTWPEGGAKGAEEKLRKLGIRHK